MENFMQGLMQFVGKTPYDHTPVGIENARIRSDANQSAVSAADAVRRMDAEIDADRKLWGLSEADFTADLNRRYGQVADDIKYLSPTAYKAFEDKRHQFLTHARLEWHRRNAVGKVPGGGMGMMGAMTPPPSGGVGGPGAMTPGSEVPMHGDVVSALQPPTQTAGGFANQIADQGGAPTGTQPPMSVPFVMPSATETPAPAQPQPQTAAASAPAATQQPLSAYDPLGETIARNATKLSPDMLAKLNGISDPNRRAAMDAWINQHGQAAMLQGMSMDAIFGSAVAKTEPKSPAGAPTAPPPPVSTTLTATTPPVSPPGYQTEVGLDRHTKDLQPEVGTAADVAAIDRELAALPPGDPRRMVLEAEKARIMAQINQQQGGGAAIPAAPPSPPTQPVGGGTAQQQQQPAQQVITNPSAVAGGNAGAGAGGHLPAGITPEMLMSYIFSSPQQGGGAAAAAATTQVSPPALSEWDALGLLAQLRDPTATANALGKYAQPVSAADGQKPGEADATHALEIQRRMSALNSAINALNVGNDKDSDGETLEQRIRKQQEDYRFNVYGDTPFQHIEGTSENQLYKRMQQPEYLKRVSLFVETEKILDEVNFHLKNLNGGDADASREAKQFLSSTLATKLATINRSVTGGGGGFFSFGLYEELKQPYGDLLSRNVDALTQFFTGTVTPERLKNFINSFRIERQLAAEKILEGYGADMRTVIRRAADRVRKRSERGMRPFVYDEEILFLMERLQSAVGKGGRTGGSTTPPAGQPGEIVSLP